MNIEVPILNSPENKGNVNLQTYPVNTSNTPSLSNITSSPDSDMKKNASIPHPDVSRYSFL